MATVTQLAVLRYEDTIDDGSKFTVYMTSVASNGREWVVPLRYSRFHEFFGQLVKTDRHAAALSFPQKVLFTPSNATRMRQLHDFMQQLAGALPTLSDDGLRLVHDLLDVDANTIVEQPCEPELEEDTVVPGEPDVAAQGPSIDVVVEVVKPTAATPLKKKAKTCAKAKVESPPAVRAVALTYTVMLSPVMILVTVVQSLFWVASALLPSPKVKAAA
ncbi:hypothetical protein SDRG_00378 [Saprolegnia diclina VS20]|uniref:PX domain-containing protein n=1 Tax=Saprolegnia diclina (strain VS20) TaxID=1156394 RepID=T0R853_SAPDV|nr:hypothetical protein SDRG_00378 [Saprolegnia diclina VS20]EQC42650.1 hypothetical protein SDRG_00378 [Saprolegnia diclina VS20]|eukprot:XP_008604073.1 hypothetical protein SDRG_00378 [Saprolegnia diclina VS20]